VLPLIFSDRHRDPKHTAHYTRVAGHRFDRFEELWRAPTRDTPDLRQNSAFSQKMSVRKRTRAARA